MLFSSVSRPHILFNFATAQIRQYAVYLLDTDNTRSTSQLGCLSMPLLPLPLARQSPYDPQHIHIVAAAYKESPDRPAPVYPNNGTTHHTHRYAPRESHFH